ELIVGAANMQFDPETGDYLPTHAGNPVEVRARALETLLQTLGKEETLALVKAALDVLISKDFATESTLDGVKSAVDALASTVDAGAQKVALTDSVTLGQRYEIETIHDAVTLAPGEITPNVLIPVNGANILFLAINVSASGWSLVYNHGAP